jgi:hypothetical protein
MDDKVETSNELIDRIDSRLDPVSEIDVEKERERIQDQWQRIEEAKKKAGLGGGK